MTSEQLLGRLEDIPEGATRGFDPSGDGEDSIFIVRRRGELHAYRNRCPHQGARMAWKRHAHLNRAADRIICYAHGAQFDVATGRCLLGPCLGQALDVVELRVTEQGEIYLEDTFRSEARS